MSTVPLPFVSIDQYLKAERGAEFRSEYADGQMFAMSGGTHNHARVIWNLIRELDGQLRGKRCEAAANDLRLFISKYRQFTYPDLVFHCGGAKYLDDRRDTITDATAIIEVLSPSTKNYDRSAKFDLYRSLPSFEEYLLVAQDSVNAELLVRQSDGTWILREFTSGDDWIELKSVGCRLRLDSLYDRVEF